MSVTNLGSAISGRDVESVILARAPSPGHTSEQLLSTLIPDDSDPRLWHMPAPIQVKDGDLLFIKARVSAMPHEEATFIAAVLKDGFQAVVRTDFDLANSLISERSIQLLSLPSAASEIIKDVLVYPQPARDTMRFAYSLTEVSDVTIKIFDRAGGLIDEIRELAKSPAPPNAVTPWPVSSKAPGIYYAVIEIVPSIGEKRVIKKTVAIER